MKGEDVKRYTDIKQHLINGYSTEPEQSEYFIITAGFLSYVFYSTQVPVKQELHLAGDIRYIYSVCLPMDMIKDKAIVEIFDRLLAFSELVLEHGIWDDYQKMKSQYEIFVDASFNQVRKNTDIIPETIAELLDFAENHVRDDKLYALYDFGAGTTDLTIFKPDHRSKTLRSRASKIILKGYSYIDSLDNQKINIEDEIRNYYKGIWLEFQKSGIWKVAKENIIGDESMIHFKNLTVLFSGGASCNEIIQNIFKEIPIYEGEEQFIKCTTRQINDPDDWDKTLPPYYRFAVSFGLTNDPIITHTKYINDITVIDYSHKLKPDEITYNVIDT